MTEKPYRGDIRDFRQPMVTSLGIIMGFLLNFLASWAVENDSGVAIQTTADWIIVLTLLISLTLMIWVLRRLLNNRYDEATVDDYYQITFKIYIASLSTAFSGVIASLFL